MRFSPPLKNCVAHATLHTFSPSILSYLHQIIILFLFSLHILLSIRLHRSFNSYVSQYLCYQEPAPGYISKLISARRALSPRLLHRLQLLLSSLHFTTACCPGPGFAEEELFSWRSHAQLTAAVPVPACSCPPRGPQLFHGGVQTTAQERAH